MERKSLERSNYEKLLELVPDILEVPEYKQMVSPGMMDLGIDILEDTKNYRTVALSHYFFVEGDGVPDPDVQIRIFPSDRRVEAIAYQDQFGYQEVYIREGVYKAGLKLKLDQFLNFWLNNLLAQGYTALETSQVNTPESANNAPKTVDNPPHPVAKTPLI